MGKITRRDFINGTLVAAGASALSFGCKKPAALAKIDPLYYPPSLTGLRGSHPGSNKHAHDRVALKIGLGADQETAGTL